MKTLARLALYFQAILGANGLCAVTPALDLNPSQMQPSGYLLHTNGMYGWQFALSAQAVVTKIGWYDEGQDGLFHAHQVGLWSGGALVESVTIPSGTAASLEGIYRTLDLPSALTLEPGSYTLAGTYESESEDLVRLLAVVSPAEAKGDPRFLPPLPSYAAGSEFRPPSSAILIYGAFAGPMLFVEVIPEPSTIWLLLIGGGLSFWHRRTGRSRSGWGRTPALRG